LLDELAAREERAAGRLRAGDEVSYLLSADCHGHRARL